MTSFDTFSKKLNIMNRLLKMADRVFSNAKDIHKAF